MLVSLASIQSSWAIYVENALPLCSMGPLNGNMPLLTTATVEVLMAVSAAEGCRHARDRLWAVHVLLPECTKKQNINSACRGAMLGRGSDSYLVVG